MCTARRRELIFQNEHRAEAGAPFSINMCRPRLISATHCRAQRNDFNVPLDSAGMAAHDGAFCAFGNSEGLFRTNEDEGHLDSAVHRFETR